MKLTILLISPLLLSANSIDGDFSLQGYTGVINTPNTRVLREGEFNFQFNNQFDNHLRDYDGVIDSEEDYSFGIGFLPSLELVGRLVESKETAVRDLSANIKYHIPYEHEYLPNLAIGIQDIGGSFTYSNNSYIVLDKDIGVVRTSLGYGKAGDGKRGKRMDGLFGGLDIKATEWLSVMGEHDSEENHLGVRLKMPKEWRSNFELEAIIAQNITTSNSSFAINVSIPLFDKNRNSIAPALDKKTDTPQKLEEDFNKNSSLPIKLEKKKTTTLLALQNKLVEFGFENVRVGYYIDLIYIECENSIFDHNDLDALGYIIGTLVDSKLDYKEYRVTLLKNNIQTLSIGGDMALYREYLYTPTVENSRRVEDNLIVDRSFDISNIEFLTKKANSSLFKPRVELSLGLVTTVGTESGLFDYLASLRTNLYTTLYDGLMVSAMYESPLFHSKNFDRDEVYGKMYRDKLEGRFVTTALHQTLHYDGLLNTTSIGRFYTDYSGVMNQTNIASSSGNHALGLKVGLLEDENGDKNKEIYLGKYRYFYEPLELFSEVVYGQYWNQDRGVTVQLKRFFGETEIAFYYKNVGSQYLGVLLSFPFTPKVSSASRVGQIKGKKDFHYGLRTVIRDDSGSNRLLPSSGIIPTLDFELESYYLNRDRVSQSYIKAHIGDMRSSYLLYK